MIQKSLAMMWAWCLTDQCARITEIQIDNHSPTSANMAVTLHDTLQCYQVFVADSTWVQSTIVTIYGMLSIL